MVRHLVDLVPWIISNSRVLDGWKVIDKNYDLKKLKFLADDIESYSYVEKHSPLPLNEKSEILFIVKIYLRMMINTRLMWREIF